MTQVRAGRLLLGLFGTEAISAYGLILCVWIARGQAEEIRFWLTFYERLSACR